MWTTTKPKSVRPIFSSKSVLGDLNTNDFLLRTLSESFFKPMKSKAVLILKATARLSPTIAPKFVGFGIAGAVSTALFVPALTLGTGIGLLVTVTGARIAICHLATGAE